MTGTLHNYFTLFTFFLSNALNLKSISFLYICIFPFLEPSKSETETLIKQYIDLALPLYIIVIWICSCILSGTFKVYYNTLLTISFLFFSYIAFHVVILGPYSYETFLLSFTILTKIFLLLVFYQLFNKRDILLAIKLAYYSFFLSILGIVLLADKTEPRISSFFHDPNSYGLYLTFILIMSFIFWTCWPKRRYLFIGFLSVILLVLTGSRGSLLTIGILTFIYVLYKVKEEGFQFIRSPLSILLFVLLSLSIVIGLTYRESMSKHGSSISNYGRFSQNYAGLKVIGDHAILGVGFLNSQDAIQKYPDKKFPVLPHLVIHNVYIAVFAELGIIGISLFLLFLFRFFHAQKKQPGPFSKLSKSFVLTYGIYAMLFPINFPAGIFWLPFMVILFISKLGSIQSRMSLLRPI